ncbi:hypothetical protein [Prochlorococcus sp. MIT 1303]|uniref:hypothetical protein n=1 Tax=Prochlorococcus sp. MIT 1303 TaxID=1723647 RepID=UPI0007B3B4EA|nr:hypothetical protein [Prochlorococcus sp. MIT 1303]
MSRRRTALAAALSLLPLGQPLLLGTVGITTATTAVLLLTQRNGSAWMTALSNPRDQERCA